MSAGANGWPDTDCRGLVLDSVRDVDAAGRDAGGENLPFEPFTLDAMDCVLADTGASLTVDTGHALAGGASNADLAAFAAAHGDRIAHFHPNDTREGILGRGGDEHLPFGTGNVDFVGVVDALDGWDGTLCFEVMTPNLGHLGYSREQPAALL